MPTVDYVPPTTTPPLENEPPFSHPQDDLWKAFFTLSTRFGEIETRLNAVENACSQELAKQAHERIEQFRRDLVLHIEDRYDPDLVESLRELVMELPARKA